MSWFRLDDGFHSHPKVRKAGNAAVGLWVRCATYSAEYGRDGHIPLDLARDFGKPTEIRSLIESRLWVPNGDGYLIRDYLEYNPTADQERARKAADAEKHRRWREAKASKRNEFS